MLGSCSTFASSMSILVAILRENAEEWQHLSSANASI